MIVSKRTGLITGVVAVGVAVIAGCLWLETRTGAVAAQEPKPDAAKARVEFTDDGKLKRPDAGYREWPSIGTPLTPNDLNNGDAPFPEFHTVYMDPESYAHYRKTGEFRDGTVLVKELISVGDKMATSGAGYFMGDFIGLEASIKDSKRFKDEPGNWAYFSFGHKYPLKDVVAKNAAASCNACHEKSAKQDYVFSQYYPVLRAANPTAKQPNKVPNKE